MISQERDFPALVKEVRKQLSLSQEALARELGVSYTTINRWEKGVSKPSRLAEAQFVSFFEKMIKKGKLNLSQDVI